MPGSATVAPLASEVRCSGVLGSGDLAAQYFARTSEAHGERIGSAPADEQGGAADREAQAIPPAEPCPRVETSSILPGHALTSMKVPCEHDVVVLPGVFDDLRIVTDEYSDSVRLACATWSNVRMQL